MKKLTNLLVLVLALCVCNVFTACKGDDWKAKFNDDRYVGEWIPARITYTNDGLTITDEGELLSNNDWDYGWIMLDKQSFKSVTRLSHGKYVINKDGGISFYYDALGGSYEDKYDLVSFENNELVLMDADTHSIIITLNKFEEYAIDTQDIVGKWSTYKSISYYTNGNASSGFFDRLNGFDELDISETELTLYGKNRVCSYYIENNNIVTTPALSEFSFRSAHIKRVTDDKLHIHFVSQDGKCDSYVSYMKR